VIYATQTPGHPLSRFVDHLWFHEGYAPAHRREKLLPDGTSELVIDLRPEPKRLFDRDDFAKFKSFRGSWISGKQTRHIVIEAANDSSMIGVHFKPGGTYPFLGAPLSELTDEVIELDLIWGGSVNTLRDEIMGTVDVERKFAVLERFLMLRLRRVSIAIDKIDNVVAQVLRSPHGMAMRDLAAKIGITPKHLITVFDKYVGLKPKTFERICRFQSVLHLIEATDRPAWAGVAIDRISSRNSGTFRA
jgi:AraC-like DNA-binding protein